MHKNKENGFTFVRFNMVFVKLKCWFCCALVVDDTDQPYSGNAYAWTITPLPFSSTMALE